MLDRFTALDLIALLWFCLAWLFFSWLTTRSRLKTRNVTYHVNLYRRAWMKSMAKRPMRMVDTNIMAGLQNGTAFFASTSLFAIGGVLALLNSADQAIQIFRDLPFSGEVDKVVWEVKVLGLAVLFIYAFFKFGWAYRLFNYSSILIGATPDVDMADEAVIQATCEKAAHLNSLAGSHFTLGLRAYFFALAYLGWFINGWFFIGATCFVFGVLYRRQFQSRALDVLTQT